VTRAAFDKKK